MYTIDTMIQKLEEFKKTAKNGGFTPIVVRDIAGDLEPAECCLQEARVSVVSAKTGEVKVWRDFGVESFDAEVVAVF